MPENEEGVIALINETSFEVWCVCGVCVCVCVCVEGVN